MDTNEFQKKLEEDQKRISEMRNLLEETTTNRKLKAENISSIASVTIAIITVISLQLSYDENVFTLPRVFLEKDEVEKIETIKNLENEVQAFKDLISKSSSSSPRDTLFLDDLEMRISKIELELPVLKIKSNTNLHERLKEIEILLKKEPDQLIKYHILSKDVEIIAKENENLRNDLSKLRDTLFDFYKWFIGFFVAMLIPSLSKLLFNLWDSKKKTSSEDKNLMGP